MSKSYIYLFRAENFLLLCEPKGDHRAKELNTNAYMYKVARRLNGRYVRNYNDTNVYLMS